MSLRVHLCYPADENFMKMLRERLTEGIELSFGREKPPNSNYSVLIGGRFDLSFLQDGKSLDTVIIPFAGLPVETAAQLVDYPTVAVHNLHYNDAVTAELGVALLLAAAKRVIPLDRGLRQFDWRPRFENTGSIDLGGRTATILGFGAIGQRVAKACLGLDMDVIGFRKETRASDPPYVHPLSKERFLEALAVSRALIVTIPLTEVTRGVIGREELAQLPDNSIVVNIARGPVIDQEALYIECKTGRLRAGLDVWYNYPRTEEARSNTAPADFPFEEFDNVVITPHIGGNSDRDDELTANGLAELLNAKARGEKLPNRVDPRRGY